MLSPGAVETSEDPRPIVCVDLNGVLDAYTGWRGPEHWDAPRPGAEDFLRALGDQGFRVVIFTTRWEADARAWLARHGLDRWVAAVTDRKPAAHVFVDDRAVCFRGDFGETLEEIVRFRAHWES
jgi:cation transport ATPase